METKKSTKRTRQQPAHYDKLVLCKQCRLAWVTYRDGYCTTCVERIKREAAEQRAQKGVSK